MERESSYILFIKFFDSKGHFTSSDDVKVLINAALFLERRRSGACASFVTIKTE